MAPKKIEMTAQERAQRNAEIAGAKAGREHAEDDILRKQTPMGREAADKLLGL